MEAFLPLHPGHSSLLCRVPSILQYDSLPASSALFRIGRHHGQHSPQLYRNPCLLHTELPHCVPFKRERERERGPNAGISLHIAKDALLSYAGCCLINALFLLFWVDRIDWAGTIFNNTMILMGLEILLYSRVSREYAQRIAQSEKLILQYRYQCFPE